MSAPALLSFGSCDHELIMTLRLFDSLILMGFLCVGRASKLYAH
jgi:hypothetical protein